MRYLEADAPLFMGNPYRFSGKERTLADYDFGARRYLPFRVPRWTSMDPLAEKYFSISPYAYCAADPVNLVDKKGREPIKPNAGTVAGFVRLLNSLKTGIGTSTGTMAHAAMLRMGRISFGKHGLQPGYTGPFNSSKDRYIYTKKGGWIDMSHFMFYAGRAYKYKLQNQMAKGLVNSSGFIFMSSEEQRDLLIKSYMSPVGETIQDGYLQEFGDSFIAKHSAYSYEDLPTDRFGAEFGANYFDPDSELTFAEQLQNYLIYVLLAIDPQNAPNYDNLPEDYPKRPTRTNNTTNPVYVNDNL